ncbi:BTB/POZ domain-containing protein 3-like isoform X2 [Macrobrachium nipponense]|uniref:BTB/POZ domain-containing protein 3-like isoform X2 n=1 Tax=Macrobrachium nipponense TaxID=159736 RepID=UPI0030C82A6C
MADAIEQAQTGNKCLIPKMRMAFWQDDLVNPMQRLSAIYDLCKCTDLTIIFPGYKQSLKVHRLILAMSSPVFEVMLYGPMAEKGDLILPEDSPEVFAYLIEYIYKCKHPIGDVDTTIELYHLANKYQMCHLCRLCSDKLQSSITMDNLSMMYEMSFLFEDSSLKEKCRKFAGNFSVELLTSPCLGQLSLQCMKDLLQQKLSVDEVFVYKGLLQWGASQIKNPPRITRSQKGLRQKIAALLPYIRFLTLPLKDFEQHVLPSRILTTEEGNAILKNIIKLSGDILLLAVCSPEREKRIFYSLDQYHEITLSIGDWVYEEPSKITRNNRECGSDEDDDDYDSSEVYAMAIEEGRSYNEDTSGSGSDDGSSSKWICSERGSTEIVSSVKITKEIHVGCIKGKIFDGGIYRLDQAKVHLVIKGSSGDTVRKLRVNMEPKNYQITFSAACKSPLILSPSDVYSIVLKWSSCTRYTANALSELSKKEQEKVSISYGALSIEGCMIDLEILVDFWCFRRLFCY